MTFYYNEAPVAGALVIAVHSIECPPADIFAKIIVVYMLRLPSSLIGRRLKIGLYAQFFIPVILQLVSCCCEV